MAEASKYEVRGVMTAAVAATGRDLDHAIRMTGSKRITILESSRTEIEIEIGIESGIGTGIVIVIVIEVGEIGRETGKERMAVGRVMAQLIASEVGVGNDIVRLKVGCDYILPTLWPRCIHLHLLQTTAASALIAIPVPDRP